MKEVAQTVKKHRNGGLTCFDCHIANVLIEDINSPVQTAKAKVRANA
jgi:transposase